MMKLQQKKLMRNATAARANLCMDIKTPPPEIEDASVLQRLIAVQEHIEAQRDIVLQDIDASRFP